MAETLTELDKKLQEIALNNWTQFVAMIGEDAVIAAKICMLRQGSKSYGQISIQLDLPRQTVISKVNRNKNCKC